MQKRIYADWHKYVLSWAAKVVWGHLSRKVLLGFDGPWNVRRNCRTIGMVFILLQCEELWGENRYSCWEKKLLGTKYTKLLKVLFIDELHVLVYVLFRWCSSGRAASMTLTPLEFLMCSAQYSTVSFFATDTNVLNYVHKISTKHNWLSSLVRNNVWKKITRYFPPDCAAGSATKQLLTTRASITRK